MATFNVTLYVDAPDEEHVYAWLRQLRVAQTGDRTGLIEEPTVTLEED